MRTFAAVVVGISFVTIAGGASAQSSRALSEDAIINALRCQPGTVENAKGGCDPVAGAVAPVPSGERCGPLPDGSFGIKDPVQGCLKIKDAVGGFNVGGAPRPAVAPSNGGTQPVSVPLPPVTSQPQLNLLLTFDTNSAHLTPEGEANARAFANAMKRPELSRARFEIEGHTDLSGSRSYNQALSQRRADTVKSFLASLGVASDRLIAKGYGFDQLAVPEQPVSQANRRVVARRLELQ